VVHDKEKNGKTTPVKMIATITTCAEGQLHGELDCECFKEPFPFTGLVRMIEVMEKTFDTKGYPENYTMPRSFRKARQRMEGHALDLHEHMAEKKAAYTNNKTNDVTCTFEILVRFRQNAEWQGKIHWVEKESTKEFSSIVEMSRLIDEALRIEN